MNNTYFYFIEKQKKEENKFVINQSDALMDDVRHALAIATAPLARWS